MKKILLILVVAILGYSYFTVSSIWGTEIKPWKYVVEKGNTLNDIPKIFSLNINKNFYKIWLKTSPSLTTLKAWTFSIEKSMTLSDFLSTKASSPDTLDREVTILPWWNIFDIDEMLSDKWIIEKWLLVNFSRNIPSEYYAKYPFLKAWKSLEGFIYPDTYRVALDSKLEDILVVTLNEFKKKIYDKYFNSKFYDNLIMSSIVEKEERNSTNKPIVAWILLKRLNEKIAIWADATVCYEYEIMSKDCTQDFISEHIYKKSKYNTRDKLWLPPTPISNMTDETFWAVVNPEVSDYYYYLHDNDWYIHYAKTLNEHVANVNKYLR